MNKYRKQCINCGSDKTDIGITTNGVQYPRWRKGLCKLCYLKQWRENNIDKVKIYHNKWNPITGKNRLVFKEKRITLKESPRTGICSFCGKQGRTNMHHTTYHDQDPLKDTIELCVGCHRRQHKI